MKRFPHEFEALLSAEGRQVLRGTHRACGALQREGFFSSAQLLDARHLASLTALMQAQFSNLVREQHRPLPPAREATDDTVIPKVGRISSVRQGTLDASLFDLAAREVGLWPMLQSESCRAFTEALAGVPLAPPFSLQVLCQRPFDSTGPHADHLPDHPGARHGYVDLHFCLSTRGVREQFLVFERDGHFSELRPISRSGTVNLYRLPLWHYTTPLQALHADDRRWLILTSFLPT